MSVNAFGLMLHHFYDAKHPCGQGAITANELSDIIEFLGPKNFLSPHEWTDRALSGRLESRHRCITLDDALLCQFDVALPVFEAYGLQAFWFVYSSVFEGQREQLELFRYFRTTRFSDIDSFYKSFFDKVAISEFAETFVRGKASFDPATYLSEYSFYTDNDRLFRFVRDRILGPDRYAKIVDEMMGADRGFDQDEASQMLWMNDNHLRTLRDRGHVVGLHSYNHPTALADLDRNAQRDQYLENARHLTQVLGVAPSTVSHPVNSYNADTLAILRDMGVVLGFRDNLNAPSNPTMLELPRDDHTHILRALRQ